MKTRSIFLILFLVFFLGVSSFFGHAETDNNEDTETTQEVETTDDNSKSILNDPKVKADVVKKVNKLLEVVKDNSVKVYTLGPYVYSKNIKSDDLDTDQLSKVIQELHKAIDSLSKEDLHANKIKIHDKVLSGKSGIVIDSKDVDKLSVEIKKFVQDEGVESENLTDKIKALLNMHKVADVFLDGDDVKVIEIDPAGSTKIIKDSKKLKELESKIKDLVDDSDIVSDELSELIKKLVEKKAQDSSSVLEKKSLKLHEIIPKNWPKITVESDEISKLKKRIEQLEKKIDLLIQKVDENNSQPADVEK